MKFISLLCVHPSSLNILCSNVVWRMCFGKYKVSFAAKFSSVIRNSANVSAEENFQ